MSPLRRSFTPFSELSRHKQRDLYVRLRTKIRNGQANYGENFTSHCVLNEPGRPAIYNQWFDFYFLGLDGHTIWNAALHTASDFYWDKMSELAGEKAESLAPYPDFDIKTWLIPEYDSHGRLKHYAMREEKPLEALGGKTRADFTMEYASSLIQADTGETVPVFESFEIRKGYRYGIGLVAVVDAAFIDADVIEASIARFRAMGEKEWKSETPVPRENLPRDTFENLAKTTLWEPGRLVVSRDKNTALRP